ncbi:MAG: M23 family metallopeptidase [Hyphomonas sp.]|nr:M23 family metallopeptidase [Hyphomonas sp.]
MRNIWLAALAAASLTAAPASALEIRVDPAPIHVFDLSPDRGLYDVILQNILVVNDEAAPLDVQGLRVELRREGELLSAARVPAAKVASTAATLAGLDEAGILAVMDFQFHLSRLLGKEERLSADSVLETGEAYLNASLHISSAGLPDTARVIVEGPEGDLGYEDVPVSRHVSEVTYQSPVEGRWYVSASGDAAHHHRWVVSSEFALDLARLGPDMKSHTGDGSQLTDYLTFGAPVLAAADGVVAAVQGDREDSAGMLRLKGEPFGDYMQRVMGHQQAIIMGGGFDAAAGNYVLIRHANGEHSLYAHLRKGSVQVSAGDTVRAGEPIGEAGSSGNSTEPHLHFQVIDGPDLNSARGLPVEFTGLRDDWYSMQHRHLRAGDVIEQE